MVNDASKSVVSLNPLKRFVIRLPTLQQICPLLTVEQ